jgi:hypothetical protein
VLASRDKAATKPKESEDVAAKAKGVLTVVVSHQQAAAHPVFGRSTDRASRVSTGVPGHATPTGVFSVIQKDRWHRSNIYDNAPMFYMQRITWSGWPCTRAWFQTARLARLHPAARGVRTPDVGHHQARRLVSS